MPTHEIVYTDKNGDVQVVHPQSTVEAIDICVILERNDALYTIEDVLPNGMIALPIHTE